MGDNESSSSTSRQSESPLIPIRKKIQKAEIFREVLFRLRELDIEEAAEPSFEEELWAHFSLLPLRYALDVNSERVEDVLMHKQLLNSARDSLMSAVEVRIVKFQSRPADRNHSNSGNSSCTDLGQASSLYSPPALSSSNSKHRFEEWNSSVSRESHFLWPVLKVTISTRDMPMLLTKVSFLMSEMGLNIQEAHAFSTQDGYSLDVFVVDNWEKGIEHLKHMLMLEIQNIENQSTFVPKLLSPSRTQHCNPILQPNHVDISSDACEIDASCLNFDYMIASGPNGDMYSGSFRRQNVAIKVFRVECLNAETQQSFTQEIYISRKVQHRNIVRFIGACTKPPLLCIITEFMSGGSVYDFLHKYRGVFKLQDVLKVAIDVSKAMSYLHSNNIIHRDLKSANLLMNERTVKVADFGIARVRDDSGIMTAETGTYRWMAPEVIEHKAYNHKVDVFSFGIVIWELITRKIPYAKMTPMQAAVGVVQENLRPKIPKRTHPLIVELIQRCWDCDASVRPEFSEITDILQYIAKKVLEEDRAAKRRNVGESCKLVGNSH